MNHPARAVILALFIMLTVTVSAYVINTFLTMLQALHLMPRVTIYAPGASIITNLIVSNFALDAAAQEKFAVSREFMLIQVAIYTCLLLLSSAFAFNARNPRGILTVLSCSLFVVVPGIAIFRTWAPAYFAERAPDARWVFLDLQATVLQMGLSLPLYAALFLAGVLILTDEDTRAAGAR